MWAVRFERKAVKAIAAMHPRMQKRITDAIESLSVDPFASANVKPLAGSAGFRLRVGEYRVIYRLENEVLVIVVIDVGPRGGIYK